MAKINITKPTGSEVLTLLSAFLSNNQKYIIFDSEKVGSMGLPIIYISKYTTKLEKITDQNEWQSVKNDLKGILNGAKVEYIQLAENVNSDETFYTPLTLPAASFDTLKSKYVVEDNKVEEKTEVVLEPTSNPVQTEQVMSENIETPTVTNENPVGVVSPIETESSTVPPVAPAFEAVPPVAPIGNENISYPENSQGISPTYPTVEPVSNQKEANTHVEPMKEEKEEISIPDFVSSINFDADKEMFLKACENMFDAMISKYQKELNDLEVKKQELIKKEAMMNQTEQIQPPVQNNNSQVLDFNSMMPHNETESNPAGVI